MKVLRIRCSRPSSMSPVHASCPPLSVLNARMLPRFTFGFATVSLNSCSIETGTRPRTTSALPSRTEM